MSTPLTLTVTPMSTDEIVAQPTNVEAVVPALTSISFADQAQCQITYDGVHPFMLDELIEAAHRSRQLQAPLNPAKVETVYKSLFTGKQKALLIPIDVALVNDTPYVVSGGHRIEALRQAREQNMVIITNAKGVRMFSILSNVNASIAYKVEWVINCRVSYCSSMAQVAELIIAHNGSRVMGAAEKADVHSLGGIATPQEKLTLRVAKNINELLETDSFADLILSADTVMDAASTLKSVLKHADDNQLRIALSNILSGIEQNYTLAPGGASLQVHEQSNFYKWMNSQVAAGKKLKVETTMSRTIKRFIEYSLTIPIEDGNDMITWGEYLAKYLQPVVTEKKEPKGKKAATILDSLNDLKTRFNVAPDTSLEDLLTLLKERAQNESVQAN